MNRIVLVAGGRSFRHASLLLALASLQGKKIMFATPRTYASLNGSSYPGKILDEAGIFRNVGNYTSALLTEKQLKIDRVKALVNKSLSYQPNRFLNKELAKYQFKSRV